MSILTKFENNILDKLTQLTESSTLIESKELVRKSCINRTNESENVTN